jgi:hypothetical protein
VAGRPAAQFADGTTDVVSMQAAAKLVAGR